MQHIILLEDDWMEAESAVGAIRGRFPTAHLTHFGNFGDFLLGFDAISAKTTLIISEDRLALADVREDLEGHARTLRERFPWATTDSWEAKAVPKLVLSHLLKRALRTPVLFYTHSEKEWIDSEVLKSDQVTFLQKEADMDPLLGAILQIIK